MLTLMSSPTLLRAMLARSQTLITMLLLRTTKQATKLSSPHKVHRRVAETRIRIKTSKRVDKAMTNNRLTANLSHPTSTKRPLALNPANSRSRQRSRPPPKRAVPSPMSPVRIASLLLNLRLPRPSLPVQAPPARRQPVVKLLKR